MNVPPDILTAQDIWLIGPCAESPLPQDLLARGMPQIAVDGGTAAASQVALWIGDGDSGRAPQGVPVVVKSSQDMTDMECALETLRAGMWRRLHLSGFTGGRIDHFIGNIGAIDAEMRRRRFFEQAVFYDAAGQVLQRHFAAGAQSFRHAGVFSLFTLSPAVVSLSGACDYPLHRAEVPVLSGRGISNVAHGEVRIEADVPVIVMLGTS